MKFNLLFSLLFAVLVIFAACPDPLGDPADANPPGNNAPIAGAVTGTHNYGGGGAITSGDDLGMTGNQGDSAVTFTLTANASDVDNDNLTYSWNIGGSGIIGPTDTTGSTCVFTDSRGDGNFTVTATYTVTDSNGASVTSDEFTFSFSVESGL